MKAAESLQASGSAYVFDLDNLRQPEKGAKTVRVQVPMRQRVNRAAIAKIRELKRQSLEEENGK